MTEKDSQIEMLRMMYLIRFFEERGKHLFRQNFITGAYHSSIGQEAVATGACFALEKDDYVVSTHRGHHHCLAKGADPKRVMAELMGRETGYSRGHGGSMHIFALELGLLGGNGIVGGGLPIAVGAAYSADYRNSGQVVLCFFGDGAANNGTFHESINMAALWKLPVIFVCENNHYAATTPIHLSYSELNIEYRAHGYGITGVSVDGNDVETVYDSVAEAVQQARAGNGPSLVECKTYRVDSHCMVLEIPRDPDEEKQWWKKEPISRYEKKLLAGKLLAKTDIEKLKQEVMAIIDEAEEFGKQSPLPKIDEMYTKLYA